MTLGEVNRFFESKTRVIKEEERRRASFDYLLADLIGRSVSRIYNSTNKMPEISEVYPTLFTAQEIEDKKQEKQAEAFAIKLKQFSNYHNLKFKEVGNNK